MHPKRFLSPWYAWGKPFTYIALSIALSPNRTEHASTRALASRSTIECVQNNFRAYGTFGANHTPIMNVMNTVSKRTKTRFDMT
jgi:hypothetical protein